MKNKTKIFLSIILIIGISAGLMATYLYLTYYKSNIKNQQEIYIYKDYSYSQAIDTINSSGAIKDINSFKRAALNKKLENTLKPGKYTLKKGMDNNQIIATLANGWQTPTKVVLSGNIMTLENLAGKLGKQFEADSTEFITTLNDSAFTDSLDFDFQNIIGMFILNTYEFYWTSTPKNVMHRFKKEYDKFWNETRMDKAKQIGLTPQKVITLASIVAGESNYVPEQPRIAGVYINRLNKKMKLQADPTIRYIAIKNEPGITRILKKHTKLKSPYNTYLNRGLPPGPIAIPSLSSIKSVLDYEVHSYIYFCANSTFDGTHLFAKSYTQHLKNARKFHKALTRREKEKAATKVSK